MRQYTLGSLQVSNTCIIPKSHSKVEFYDILNEHEVFLIETITAKIMWLTELWSSVNQIGVTNI